MHLRHLVPCLGYLALTACDASTEPDDPIPAARLGHIPGDFDWDGDSDLLFQRSTDVTMKVWRMDGSVRTGDAQFDPIGPADREWRVVATGDFSGDMKPDLLFQHRISRRLVVWFMDDFVRTWGGYL